MRYSRTCGIAVLAVLLAALSAATATAATAATKPSLPHAHFSDVLRDVVRDGRVDYRRLTERHAAALDRYLDAFASDDFAGYPEPQRLASYLNLYNATVLKAVAGRYRPGYSVAEKDFALFKEPLVRVGGRVMSLDELEHKVIRPTFRDARVHAALNCAAASCPPLIDRAYTADDLEQLLEENMRRFVNDSSRNVIDRENRRLKLSKIFEWFADDFGGPEGVKRTIGKYAGVDVSEYAVEYLEYDWRLNDAER